MARAGSAEVKVGGARGLLTVVVVLAAAALGGCSDLFRDAFDDIKVPDVRVDTDAQIDPTAGKGVGESCDPSALFDCRFGLKCLDGACRATGDTQENRPCILTSECGDGLHCSLAGVCRASGDGAVGASCSSAADCERGLVCLTLGFAGTCVAAGPGDLGATCDGVEDCLAGLACAPEGECGPGSPVFGLKLWPGVACEPEETERPPRVHFEVPRATAEVKDDGDFFRLPFPNDIRMKDGRVDLSGFPTPGPGVVGFDPVDRVARAAEAVQKGFSTVPAVTFRLSRGFDLGTVWAGGAANPQGDAPTLYFLNIDKDSAQYGWTPDFGYFVTDGGTRYICPRFIGVHPAWYTPLLPGTTYAVILAQGLKTPDGVPFEADDDMKVMLAAEPPAAELRAAWDAYAPLRAYLADPDAKLPSSRVLAAAVFTTQPVQDLLPEVRASIHAGPMPQPKQITTCKAGVTSPCDDGLTGDGHVRGCFDEAEAFYELHMKVPLPMVQAGTRPYLRPEDGGDVPLDEAGRVMLQGTEDVCVSLTIPKGAAMPEAGWPVAIYGHGTGGSFRSAVRDLGEPLSLIEVPALGEAPASSLGVAVLGWDGPMHGPRRGAELDPEGLFYNFANPLAARGNLVQGAADVFALTRALATWRIPAEQSPTGAELRFDPTKLLYVGHSQGATTGPLATPYEPGLRAVVWSGAGAGLVLSLLAKKSPVDAPLAAAVALQELDNGVPVPLNDLHPALGLVQGLFDALDPLNHARFQTVERDPDHPIQHVLHVYGLGDTYTPPSTIETFARVMRLGLAIPVLKDLGPAFFQLTPPVRENLSVPGGRASAALVQVQPDGYDGHFVLFRDATMKRRFAQWVGTFVRDGAPTLMP